MTTSTYRVEGLRSAMAMAVAMERLATLPGVTKVTVNLSHQEPSVLVLQATTRVLAARISECLRPVGARLADAERPGCPGSSADLRKKRLA